MSQATAIQHARACGRLDEGESHALPQNGPPSRSSRQPARLRPVGYGVAAFSLLTRAKAGGAEGDRTPDLVIANDALSQLSYGPTP